MCKEIKNMRKEKIFCNWSEEFVVRVKKEIFNKFKNGELLFRISNDNMDDFGDYSVGVGIYFDDNERVYREKFDYRDNENVYWFVEKDKFEGFIKKYSEKFESNNYDDFVKNNYYEDEMNLMINYEDLINKKYKNIYEDELNIEIEEKEDCVEIKYIYN